MKKHPGTAGLMPVKGSGCGIRPNVEEMEDSEGFDFSGAAELLEKDAKPHPSPHGQAPHPASDSEDQSSPESQG